MEKVTLKRVTFSGEIDDYLVNTVAILDSQDRFVKWEDFSVVHNGRWVDDFPESLVKKAEDDVVLFAQDEAGINCVEVI